MVYLKVNTTYASLAVNTACAAMNFYLAPKSFSLSFAAGLILGCGVSTGLYTHFTKILTVEHYIKKIDEQIKRKETTEKIEHKGFFSKISHLMNRKVSNLKQNTNTSKTTIDKIDLQQKLIDAEINPFLDRAVKISLYISGYDKKSTDSFKVQINRLIKRLNPVPGLAGTCLSIGSLALNLINIANPILSKMSLFSGYTMGYAVGTRTQEYFFFKFLNTQSLD